MWILIGIVGVELLLLVVKFKTPFMRAYGLSLLILVVYASNKGAFGISPDLYDGTFSPLSSVRWICLGLLAAAAVAIRTPQGLRPSRSLMVAVILLIAWMFFSSSYSSSIAYSFMRATSFALMAFAAFRGCAIFFSSARNARQLFDLMYYTACLTLLPFFVLRLMGSEMLPFNDPYGHFMGMFANPNTLAGYSALLVPFVVFQWKQGSTRTARNAALLVLIIAVTGVLVSRSRGGTIATILAIAAYLFTVDPKERIRLSLATTALIVAVVLFPRLLAETEYFMSHGGEVTAVEEETRYAIWNGVFPIFWQQKWTGMGFAASHQEVFNFTEDQDPGRSVHNSYLELFGDLGIPGIALLLLLFQRVAKRGLLLLTTTQSHADRSISAVFISCFVAGSVNAFVESWMFSIGSAMAIIFWTAVGGMVGRGLMLVARDSAQDPVLSRLNASRGAVTEPAFVSQ